MTTTALPATPRFRGPLPFGRTAWATPATWSDEFRLMLVSAVVTALWGAFVRGNPAAQFFDERPLWLENAWGDYLVGAFYSVLSLGPPIILRMLTVGRLDRVAIAVFVACALALATGFTTTLVPIGASYATALLLRRDPRKVPVFRVVAICFVSEMALRLGATALLEAGDLFAGTTPSIGVYRAVDPFVVFPGMWRGVIYGVLLWWGLLYVEVYGRGLPGPVGSTKKEGTA
jgi:hypothetical protein